jgi:hypothetical protein
MGTLIKTKHGHTFAQVRRRCRVTAASTSAISPPLPVEPPPLPSSDLAGGAADSPSALMETFSAAPESVHFTRRQMEPGGASIYIVGLEP